MSSFDFTRITVPGAFSNAMKAARESDRRDARRHLETRESRDALKGFQALARRVAAALAEKRPADSQLTSHPV